MLLKTKTGRVFEVPTEAEEAEIQAGIEQDPDAASFSDQEWDKIQPILKRGRPFARDKKEQISIRLSKDVIEGLRSTGAGWQTRIDQILKEWLKNHSSVA